MKTFIHLTKEECLSVYLRVEANAEDLIDSANILANHGHYGNAISLLILGSEEYIKSFFLFLEAYGFELRRLKEMQSLFSRHSARHNILRDSYSIWTVLKHIFEINSHSSRKDILSQFVNAMVTVIPAMDNHEWWEKADLLKQRGLYVDYLNTVILPSHLTKDDYDDTFCKDSKYSR